MDPYKLIVMTYDNKNLINFPSTIGLSLEILFSHFLVTF